MIKYESDQKEYGAYIFDFSGALRDDVYRSEETAWVEGAKTFLRKFKGGFWESGVRTKDDVLELLVNMNIGKTLDDAREIFNLLEGKTVRYTNEIVENNFFTLTKVLNPQGKEGYALFRSYRRI